MGSDRTANGGSRRRGMALVPWALLASAFCALYALYFSPVWLQAHYLAPGDGEVYYLPFFGLPIAQTWNDLILSGAPVLADIQSQDLYVLRWLSPSFNFLVISAYAVCAIGMFGLSLRLTGSRLGALASAIVVSGSGFMVGHLGHLSIIHAAAWIPFMLWAVASMRRQRGGWPVVLGALATALSIYGGHPQISIMGMLLAGSYGACEILTARSREGREAAIAVFGRLFAMFALGLLLAAPVLMPFIDAAGDGVRSAWSKADFDSYSHTPDTLRLLLFPNLLGANEGGPYGAYAGPWNLTELAIYAGSWTWVLAFAALLGWRRDRAHWFWIGVVLAGVLLSLGTATPLGEVIYRLPVLGKFRAQARFGIVVIIALGVLSAFGLSALLRQSWSATRLAQLLALSAGFFLLFGLWVAIAPVPAVSDASLWLRPAVWLPILLMVLSLAITVVIAHKRCSSMAPAAFLFLVVDLASFGWFYEWKYPSATSTREILSPATSGLIADIAGPEGRMLPLNAASMSVEPVRPNVNIRYGLPSVVGYGPLVSGRYATYAGAGTTGSLGVASPSAPLMDVLAVRWIAGSPASMETQLLGTGCGAIDSLQKIRARVPEGIEANAIAVISHLGCSTEVPSGTTLADVRMIGPDGSLLERATIEAGEETAEWAYDRSDVRSVVAHARPQVAETFDAGGFTGLWFKGQWPRPAGSAPVRTIEVGVVGDRPVPVRIKSVQVIDASGAITPLPLEQVRPEDEQTLGNARIAPGLPPVRERVRYRGMAWAVCSAHSAKTAEIVADLAGNPRADGSRFDAHREALIEEGIAMPPLGCATPPNVQVVNRGTGSWELRSEGAGPALLVISESYNADWVASVDGVDSAVVPVDGLVLGVPIPAGTHRIQVRYEPRSFHKGLWLALLALALCIAVLFSPWRRLTQVRSSKVITKDGT